MLIISKQVVKKQVFINLLKRWGKTGGIIKIIWENIYPINHYKENVHAER